MRRLLLLFVLVFPLFCLQVKAAGSSLKLEFGGTSMTIELSQQPKILTENGNLVLKTNSMTVTLSLPCKATFQGVSNGIEEVINIRNNSEDKLINVFTIDGRKVATLKDKNETLSLKRGVYIINGKKVFIK